MIFGGVLKWLKSTVLKTVRAWKRREGSNPPTSARGSGDLKMMSWPVLWLTSWHRRWKNVCLLYCTQESMTRLSSLTISMIDENKVSMFPPDQKVAFQRQPQLRQRKLPELHPWGYRALQKTMWWSILTICRSVTREQRLIYPWQNEVINDCSSNR